MTRAIFIFAVLCCLTSVLAVGPVYDYRPQSEWPGICQTGTMQSPINIDSKRVRLATSHAGRVDFGTFGVVSEYNIFFTGSALEVEFHEFLRMPHIRVPANAYMIGNSTNVKEGDLLEVELIQMHFHTISEHTFNGLHAPGELHIVTYIKEGESDYCDATGGCIAVFAVMLTYESEGNEGNAAISRLFEIMPEYVGPENGLMFHSDLHLDQLVPEERDYYTYLGSLTTPPCTESVTWIIFAESVPVEPDLIEKHEFETSYTPGDDCTFTYRDVCAPPREKVNNRLVRPLSGRQVFYVGK